MFFLLLIERLVTVSFDSVNQKTVNSLTFTLYCLQIDSQTTRKKKNGYSPKHLASPVEIFRLMFFPSRIKASLVL